jgi:hypothetical protein
MKSSVLLFTFKTSDDYYIDDDEEEDDDSDNDDNDSSDDTYSNAHPLTLTLIFFHVYLSKVSVLIKWL